MTPIPITLASAALCVVVNLWLGWRIAQLREDLKVSVGDGGHEALLRRMRAQANFVENAPLMLILVGALELSGANKLVLGALTLIFILARIAHGIGMEGGTLQRWRMVGMAGTMPINLALAAWALVRVGEQLLGR
jgi:uncharacterized membrane protein YecN with MAPEG domain